MPPPQQQLTLSFAAAFALTTITGSPSSRGGGASPDSPGTYDPAAVSGRRCSSTSSASCRNGRAARHNRPAPIPPRSVPMVGSSIPLQNVLLHCAPCLFRIICFSVHVFWGLKSPLLRRLIGGGFSQKADECSPPKRIFDRLFPKKIESPAPSCFAGLLWLCYTYPGLLCCTKNWSVSFICKTLNCIIWIMPLPPSWPRRWRM